MDGLHGGALEVRGMNIIVQVRAFFRRARPSSHIEWFVVTYDDRAVHLRAEPPGKQPWSQSFAWDSLTRVCFKAEDLFVSDGIYVFTTQRPESYAIPTEARGGRELWFEILRRKLFDANLAIEAACSTEGLYCWPPKDRAT